MGGGGPAETCRTEPSHQRDTACPALPWHCPHGEEAEGLVLALLADPVVPLSSCSGPGLHLWAIAPTRPPLMGTEVATGKTCTLGLRGISEAITDEKKRELVTSSSSESSGLHVRSKGEKRTDMQFSYHHPHY